MSETLERLTDEVRKLTPSEVDQLRSWIISYRPPSENQTERSRVDWSGHSERVIAILGTGPSTSENVVLALREEERF